MPSTSSQSSFLRPLTTLIESLPNLISDRVQLASLEIRRAGKALGLVIGCVLAGAVCLATAWIALWICISVTLVDMGVSRGVVAAAVLLVNVLMAAAALWWGWSKVHLIALPATVRQLTVSQSPAAAVSINIEPGVVPLRREWS